MQETNPLTVLGPITTKAYGNQLYARGVFGNAFPLWKTVDALEESGFTGLVNIRRLGRGGAKRVPPTQAREVREKVLQLNREGIPNNELVFSQTPPYHLQTMVGEVCRTDHGLYLRYSRMKEDCRIAFERGLEHALGLRAKLLLEHFLDPSSYDDLQVLLDHFYVVEIMVFQQNVGTVAHRNTVFAEVRDTF